jgi:hypothetical protein
MAGIKQQASPVLLGRTTEAEVVDPVQPELYGTLTNRFGGNAFFISHSLSDLSSPLRDLR